MSLIEMNFQITADHPSKSLLGALAPPDSKVEHFNSGWPRPVGLLHIFPFYAILALCCWQQELPNQARY